MNDQSTAADTSTIRLERLLPGPIERVWEYLTDSEKRSTWFAAGKFDLRVGGKVELDFDHSTLSSEKEPPDRVKSGSKHHTGTITRCEPPRLLAYAWSLPEGSDVTFELVPKGKDVLLIITHRGIAKRSESVNFASGWDTHVGILEDRLNGVEPRPFWTTHARLVKEYDARM